MATRRFRDTADPALDALYEEVAQRDLQPLWTQEEALMGRTPPRAAVPHLWRGEELLKLSARSGELVGIDRGGDRRVLALANPGLAGQPYATPTLWGGIQYLNAGEIAPAHRHTPAALRFVLDGGGVWTLVNGDSVAMQAGDLVLTPSMAWHEHYNASDQPMVWFDGLDFPLVQALDGVFFEQGRDALTVPASPPLSDSEQFYGAAAGIVPVSSAPALGHSPLFAYRWRQTDAALSALLAVTGTGHAAVRYTDPTTGADVMPTMRCEMHRLVGGTRTPTTRENGSSIWVCYSGSAEVTVGDQRWTTGHGDIFAVPSWATTSIVAQDTATFFRVSDTPVFQTLSLYRHETLDSH